MGRIAEALKRAQQERTRLAGAGSAVLAPPAGSPGEVPASPPAGAAETCWKPVPHATGSTAVPSQAGAAAHQAAPSVAHPSASLAEFLSPPVAQPFFVSAPPVVPDDVGPEVVVFHDPGSPIAERYRSARTRLVTGNPGGSARVFAVTSSQPREGKTVTTANLGFSLAELRHLRVAMIDCDFRRRGLSTLFNVKDRPGIAEVIRGERTLADVCVPVVRDNLFLVPTGDPGSISPSELLTGARAVAVFREINERFHYGLIDTPPTDTTADIGLIAPLCHSVVIVLRMSRTPEHLLRRCVRMLQANHVEIAGSILVGYCEKTMGYTDTHDYYESRG
jgi:capsular exopolysaccharide synthesis family protein